MAAALAVVPSCDDTRCTDGITSCAGCNGWGVVNPKGKRYRVKCKELPTWAVPHKDCHGTGLAACGCRELDAVAAATLGGTAQQDTAAG